MTIIEISQRSIGKASQEFLEAGRQVFAGDPNWIPPLNIMLRDQLSPKSPYFRHADATFFTARKNGRIVGRISAQVDQQHLQLHQDECGFFGFFDTIDDQDVASALYKAASKGHETYSWSHQPQHESRGWNADRGFRLTTNGHDASLTNVSGQAN